MLKDEPEIFIAVAKRLSEDRPDKLSDADVSVAKLLSASDLKTLDEKGGLPSERINEIRDLTGIVNMEIESALKRLREIIPSKVMREFKVPGKKEVKRECKILGLVSIEFVDEDVDEDEG